jgi:cation:H+ antiporter
MAAAAAIPLFAVSLAVTLVAAATFARRLDLLGARFGLPEVWIGLLSAIAADGPEISSALIALFKGAHAAGVGVIVGSNTFNIAAMVGVSALIAGSVRITRRTLALEGTVGLAVMAAAIALLLGWVPASACVAALAAILVPYLVLVLGGHQLAARLGLARLAGAVLEPDTIEGERRDHAAAHRALEFAVHRQVGLMVLDLALIVGGSFGMVEAALALGHRWALGAGLVGALILGPLTSLPNALTGIRLGMRGRGAALVTETLNSNTINLVFGVAIPALFVTLAAHSWGDRVDLALLAVQSVALTVFLMGARGIRRPAAASLIALYGAYVAVTLAAS